jgi:hypothetical protein
LSSDADSRDDARAAQVELAPEGVPQHRRLEASGEAGREELLRVGAGPARAAHLTRYVEVNVQATVARTAMTFTTACDGRFGGIEDLDVVVHRALSFRSIDRAAGRVAQRTVKTPFIPAAACPGTVHR